MEHYEVLEDGSILFKKPFSFKTVNYYQDPNNPLRYIPKYEPCKYRLTVIDCMPCGRKTVDWKCKLFNKGVSVPICRSCTIEDK